MTSGSSGPNKKKKPGEKISASGYKGAGCFLEALKNFHPFESPRDFRISICFKFLGYWL